MQIGKYLIETMPNGSFDISWRTNGAWLKLNTIQLPIIIEKLVITECIPYEQFIWFLEEAKESGFSETELLYLLEAYNTEYNTSLSITFLLGNYRKRIDSIFGGKS